MFSGLETGDVELSEVDYAFETVVEGRLQEQWPHRALPAFQDQNTRIPLIEEGEIHPFLFQGGDLGLGRIGKKHAESGHSVSEHD